jgi:hypothetical protein
VKHSSSRFYKRKKEKRKEKSMMNEKSYNIKHTRIFIYPWRLSGRHFNYCATKTPDITTTTITY